MMKKSAKSLLCVILTVVMLLTALPVTVYADGNIISVSTAEALTAACARINENGGEYTIELDADIDGGHIEITNGNANVTVIGNGHTITASIEAVYVSGGATVNLGDGNSELFLTSDDNNDDPGIVYVLSDSTCNMYDKVTIKDHKGNNYLGGGVSVEGGTFNMHGGTIQNCGIDGGSVCYGGGVGIFADGNFIMDGGTITGCYATSDYIDDYDPNRSFVGLGGGVFVTAGSNFTMNGGTISNNTATNMGGGVAMVMSDSYDYSSEWKTYSMGNPMSNVTINGGTITGNEADCGAGVFASGYFYAFAGAFGWTLPTGVSVNPGLFINGGEISANEATDMGGGVLVAMLRPAAPVRIHNAEIKNNTAELGAGITNFGFWTQMDIEGCTITDNTAESSGGGIFLSSNSSGGFTNLKNTTITGNKSGARGAGVCYDANSKLTISGANTIQNNTYNGKLNNLNILSKDYPVYVDGALSGSQIGLSDPTLWDDGKEDFAADAVSTEYLTSGYLTYNTGISPSDVFTSDHESWFADHSDVNTNEVRLVRKKPDYHINNADIAVNYPGTDDSDPDIFTDEVEEAIGKEVKVGDVIKSFYLIPEATPTEQDSCPYIFKGWYYDQDNDNDKRPVKFGEDVYAKDIYAHWIKVNSVAQDDEDDNVLLESYNGKYGGFDLAGVQVREGIRDTNFGEEKKPGGLRFLTSLSMDVVSQINKIKPNNIEYGYVAASNKDWIQYHAHFDRKLLYVSKTANGFNTLDPEGDENYFGFASNIDCTSRKSNSRGIVREDHRNYHDYLLYTLVITYENVDESAYGKNVLARPYIRYTDANGLERVAYSEYRGASNTLGGCYTSYNYIAEH